MIIPLISRILATATSVLTLAASGIAHAQTFTHPGCLSTQADLDRMKAKIAAGAEPWTSAYAVLVNNPHSSASYNANPLPYINRGGSNQNYTSIMHDAAAAYQCALRWKLTGDTSFAEAAMRNMDGYSSTLVNIGGSTDALLCLGAQGFDFACAAELLRDYQPWIDSGGFDRFKTMLLEKFYRNPANGAGMRAFLDSHNGTVWSHYWLNWDGFALSAVAAIGVVCDRRDIFDYAVNYYKTAGAGNGLATHALYFMHPGYLGQSQEMGRDMGHASVDPVLLAQFAEVAWNQGEDIYGYNDNGILAMSEYTRRAMTADGVPWVNYVGVDGVNTTNVATGSNFRAGVDMIWNHYVNRRGLSAPYTTAWALANRPEGGGGNYGGNSGGFDQIGFTTLTHALDVTTAINAPSSLKADAPLAGTARVWWYGSANATGYNVKRATVSGGPYTVVASNLTAQNFLYTDTCLTPDTTYYYVVSAIVNGVETTDSQQVGVTANQRLTGTVIGTDAVFFNGQWKYQLFDNAPVTWFDASTASGAWAGLDLGVSHRITKVGYYPRATFASRMTGGQFQGSNVADFSSGVVTLLTIGSQPSEGTTTVQNVTDTGAYRYVRYIGPDNGYCNAAEILFEGFPSPAVAPSAPTHLSAVAGNAAVTLKWAAAGDTTGFHIKRATVSGGPYTVIAGGYTSAIYTDTAVTNGVTYYYVVSGANATGESANSAEVTITPSMNALAGSVVWTGMVGNVWDTTTLNWQRSGGLSTYQEGDRVLFDDASGPNTTVNLSADRSPSAVTFNNGWRNYTLTGSAINCSGALVKNGNGALSIPGAHTFGGGAVLAGGRTTIQNVNSLGTGSLTLSGGTLSTSGDMTLAKDIAVSGGGGLSLGSPNNLTYSGTITGNGWLTLGDDGNVYSLNLSGINGLTGGTVTIANNSNYVRFKTTAMGNGNTDWVFNNTTPGRTTLDFASGTMVLGSLSGNGVIQGNVGGAMNVTLLIGGNNNSSIYSGAIHDNPAGTGSISLTKTGTGALQLTGACDYSGTTVVNGGSLTVSTVFAGKGSCQTNAGTTLGVTNTSSGSAIFTSLTLAADSTLELNNVTNSLTPLLACNGNVALNGASTVNVTQIPAGLRPGTYPLVSYTGSLQGPFSNLQLQLPAGVNGALVNNTGQIALSITSVPAPAAPTGLTALLTEGQVALSWTGAQYADTYHVWRATTIGGPYTLIATTSGTNYTDSGVPPFATNYYKITAVNATGESDSTATVNSVRGTHVAHLAFDETSGTTAADATGNGWNGTLVNGPTWTTGRTDNAVSLDGSNDYVSLPTGVVSNLGNFTISAWVKLNSINMWSRIFDFGTGTSVNMFLTASNGTGVPRFAITTGGYASEQGINGTAALPTGVWTHVAVILKDGIGTLYVNGEAVGATAMTLTPASLGATTKNYIGKSQYNDPYLNGSVDEFHLYNFALNASELGSLAGWTPGSAPDAPTGLTAASPSSNRINLAWTPSSGATGYNIRRATTSGGPYVFVASNVAANSYSDDTVSPLITYYYVVSAVSSTGESASSAEASARPDYLKLHLKFDEATGTTAADSSGNGNNCTLVNGPVFDTGKLNNGLGFTGASQYATLPAGLMSTLNDFTISIWVKPTSLDTWARVFDFGTGTATNMFLTTRNGANGKPRFAIKINNSAEQQIDAANALTAGVWNHLVVTLSGSTGTIYVNGVASGTNTAMSFKPSGMGNTTLNYLGKSQWNDPYLNGTLDDFRIYTRVLSASEVGLLAAGQLAAPQNLTATPGTAQIALSWNAVSGASGYTVRSAAAIGGPYADVAVDLPGMTCVDSGLGDGETRYYTVVAHGRSGDGVISNPVSATTYTAIQNWRLTHFGTVSNIESAADEADPDGDGWTNAREYIAGTNPNDPSSVLKVTKIQINGNDIQLNFPTVSGKTYRLERSDTLSEGSWTTVAENIAGTGAEIQVTDTGGATHSSRFYRIVVQP